MASPQEQIRTLDLVDSMDSVEFDAEDGMFRAKYDRESGQTSLAVVTAVAAAADREPNELSPLHSPLDADALGAVFSVSNGSG